MNPALRARVLAHPHDAVPTALFVSALPPSCEVPTPLPPACSPPSTYRPRDGGFSSHDSFLVRFPLLALAALLVGTALALFAGFVLASVGGGE